jgi:hypothetical protein
VSPLLWSVSVVVSLSAAQSLLLPVVPYSVVEGQVLRRQKDRWWVVASVGRAVEEVDSDLQLNVARLIVLSGLSPVPYSMAVRVVS